MSDLTPQEQEQLFRQVSNAMKDDDNAKLSSLLTAEAPIEEEQPAEETPAEKEEEIQEETPNASEEQPEEVEGKEKKSPQEETPADEKKEPTEQEKLITSLREQLDAANKAAHKLSSQVGRIPDMQRKIALIDKKLESLNGSPSSQASTKIKPKVDSILKDIEETDPTLAQRIAEAMAVAVDGVDTDAREQQKADLIQERQQLMDDHREEQMNRLLSMYPNAPQVFASPHWAEWKKQQPAHILGMAQSDSADAVAFAFQLYANDMRAKYPDLNKTEEQPADGKQTEQPPDPEAEAKARQIEEERNRRKKEQPNASTSKTGKRVSEPTDPQALFEHFSKQIREGKG